tara:strand:+ start:4700 stop:5260 length:561 start_codon:yes stop_codon:yes gene_type:complete
MAKNLALFEGSWQKVLIRVVLLLLVLFVVYSLIKRLIPKLPTKSQKEIEDYIQNDLQSTPPPDSSTQTDPDTISDSEAQLLANGLENAMKGWGTTDDVLDNLSCLNGASLQKIYAAYGVRSYDGLNPYDTPEMLDLFGWFSEELSNVSAQWKWSNCVAKCDSYFSFCGEKTFQREIWSKSGIPVTF